jgi:hypothetical protein
MSRQFFVSVVGSVEPVGMGHARPPFAALVVSARVRV